MTRGWCPKAMMILCGVSLAGCATGGGSGGAAPGGEAPAAAAPAAPVPSPVASGVPPPSPVAPAAPAPGLAGGIALTEHDTLQKVGVARDARLGAYEVLVVTETRADVPQLNPDGRENLEWARGVVRSELAGAIRQKAVFREVVTADSAGAPRTLVLDTTIVGYEKGGGAARFWAGLYGAGQPVVVVRGILRDGDRPLLVFEARRSGVGGKSRWLGGYLSDKEVQTRDIQDLAAALADLLGQQTGRQ